MYFVVRELRYILLLLVVGLYASWQRADVPVSSDASSPSASESSMPSVLHNTLEDYAKRIFGILQANLWNNSYLLSSYIFPYMTYGKEGFDIKKLFLPYWV